MRTFEVLNKKLISTVDFDVCSEFSSFYNDTNVQSRADKSKDWTITTEGFLESVSFRSKNERPIVIKGSKSNKHYPGNYLLIVKEAKKRIARNVPKMRIEDCEEKVNEFFPNVKNMKKRVDYVIKSDEIKTPPDTEYPLYIIKNNSTIIFKEDFIILVDGPEDEKEVNKLISKVFNIMKNAEKIEDINSGIENKIIRDKDSIYMDFNPSRSSKVLNNYIR